MKLFKRSFPIMPESSDSDTANKVKQINRKRRATMSDSSDFDDVNEAEKHHDDESTRGHEPKSNKESFLYKCYF